MREKYESLSVSVLRELAKSRGIKGTSGMKKANLVEAMLAKDEEEAAGKQESAENGARQENREPRESAQRQEHHESGAQRHEQHGRAYNKGENPRHESQRKSTPPVSLEDTWEANGILEVMQDGFGFIRCENYLPGENDVYVSPSQIRKFNLKTGRYHQRDRHKRIKPQHEKFSRSAVYLKIINGLPPGGGCQTGKILKIMTPIFPNQSASDWSGPGCSVAMRIVDLISPIGKGQRGMIVSQPKAGKTTLLKEMARSVTRNSSGHASDHSADR